MAGTKTGYCNGSDMLLYVGGKAVGSCTTHTTTFSSETKERAVKPVATAGISGGLWKKKGVVGLSYSISAEGLRFYGEHKRFSGFSAIYEESVDDAGETQYFFWRADVAPLDFSLLTPVSQS